MIIREMGVNIQRNHRLSLTVPKTRQDEDKSNVITSFSDTSNKVYNN